MPARDAPHLGRFGRPGGRGADAGIRGLSSALTDPSRSAKLDPMAGTEDDRTGKREPLFCPYCFEQQFDRRDIEGPRVYCEVCGVEVDVKDLVRP